MSVLVNSYTEDGYQEIPSIRLSDDEYGRGLQCFVPACTDIVPINSEKKLMYLAHRISKPIIGWWWIGGRMEPDETKEEAAIRNFRRETKLRIDQSQLKLVAVLDYRWNNRAQSPAGIGCHMLGYTFTIELKLPDFVYISENIDGNEYDTGLFTFDRKDLVEKGVFPSILNLYDHIFPKEILSR